VCVCARVQDHCGTRLLPRVGRGCVPTDRTRRPTLQDKAVGLAFQDEPAPAKWRGRTPLSCHCHVIPHAPVKCLLRTRCCRRLRAKQDRDRLCPAQGFSSRMNPQDKNAERRNLKSRKSGTLAECRARLSSAARPSFPGHLVLPSGVAVRPRGKVSSPCALPAALQPEHTQRAQKQRMRFPFGDLLV